MSFPATRLRRLRDSPALRALIRETTLTPDKFVLPLFVTHGEGVNEPIAAMPGQSRLSVDTLVKEAAAAKKLGVGGVILFGIPESKDERGSEAYADDGIVPRAIRALKAEVKDLVVMGDVCLCEYTSHGHCGVVEDDYVQNDATLELLADAALAMARAGADVVAPSDMMDGRVRAIRTALEGAGLARIAILSYAVKYASAYYGPFRQAAGSTPAFGDRRAYQMDPGNGREAMREVALDVEEGADMIMVKPALPCLDVLARVREAYDLPLAAYQVSGEYSQIKAAAERGWIDGERVMMESLTAIRRAGADFILTYFATEAARVLGG